MQEKKQKEEADPGWTPILLGQNYCSPRCGRGCTKKEHDAAVEKAKDLAEKLGPRWSPVVWENLGWHYCAKSDLGEVHRFGPRYYWASLHAGEKQFIGEATTPKKAVDKALQSARDLIALVEAMTEKGGES